MWKNKHLIAALLVAPVLALIAYFTTDYLVAERPHAATAGASYPLVAKSNCRYASGECDLVNGDVQLTLKAATDASGTHLHLASDGLRLQEAIIALARNADDSAAPVDLRADDASATAWSIDLGGDIVTDASLRLVVLAGDSRYFAEVPTTFFAREATATR